VLVVVGDNMGNLTKIAVAITPPCFPDGRRQEFAVYETEGGSQVCRYEAYHLGSQRNEFGPSKVRNHVFMKFDSSGFATVTEV
jgi:hypothetical protein